MSRDGTSLIDRRDFVKATGIAGAGVAFAGSVTAVDLEDIPQINIGKRRFVEVAMEYENSPEYPRYHSDGLSPHITEIEENRVIANDAPLKPFEREGTVVTLAGQNYHSGASTLSNDGRIPAESSYDGLTLYYLKTVSENPTTRFDVRTGSGNIKISTQSTEAIVSDGEEKEIELDEVEVDVHRKGTETRTVETPNRKRIEETEVRLTGSVESVTLTPKIRVRNNGMMKILGSSDFRIIPIRSSNDYARRRVSSYRSMKPEAFKEIEKRDVLLVEKKGRNRRGGK